LKDLPPNKSLSGIHKQKSLLCLLALCAIGGFALSDFLLSSKTRQTFVFYNMKTGTSRVEERMLLKYPSKEMQIEQYVEEAVFGPRSSDAVPLFANGTQLLSLLYRNKAVYINLSEDAAFPVITEDMEANAASMTEARTRSFTALDGGLKRNFPFVEQTFFFIEGRSIEY
jgi:hypothetical protein